MTLPFEYYLYEFVLSIYYIYLSMVKYVNEIWHAVETFATENFNINEHVFEKCVGIIGIITYRWENYGYWVWVNHAVRDWSVPTYRVRIVYTNKTSPCLRIEPGDSG